MESPANIPASPKVTGNFLTRLANCKLASVKVLANLEFWVPGENQRLTPSHWQLSHIGTTVPVKVKLQALDLQ